MATYSEKLRDPRWQKKRLETLEAAGWACENCGEKESTLNVHHKRYFKGRMPWEYDREWLAVLCEGCHGEEHSDATFLDQVLASAPVGSIGQIAGLAAGYLGQCGLIDDDAFLEQFRQLFPASYRTGRIGALFEQLGKELPTRYDLSNPFPSDDEG